MKSLKKVNEHLNFGVFVSKKLILLVLLTSTCTMVWSQSGPAFGIKGGLNYNANGDYFQSLSATADNPQRNIGFHLGVFGKLGNQLFLRPELIYTSTKSNYDDGDFSMKKIDAPVLVGIKVLGPVSVFAGPAFQYIVDSKFDDVSIDEVDKDLTVGLNFGAGINFERFGIDLRYERGFSNNEAEFLNNNIDTSRLDTRPSQFIVSLSVTL